MKKFESPVCEIIIFTVDDVLTSSDGKHGDGRSLCVDFPECDQEG